MHSFTRTSNALGGSEEFVEFVSCFDLVCGGSERRFVAGGCGDAGGTSAGFRSLEEQKRSAYVLSHDLCFAT